LTSKVEHIYRHTKSLSPSRILIRHIRLRWYGKSFTKIKYRWI